MPGGYANQNDREEWRPVARAPEYAVSNHGRVMRLLAKPGTRACKVLKPHINEKGYFRIVLRTGGEKIDARVHRLVCEAFIGPATDERPVVRHLDGNPANNHISNLVWGTPKENMEDKYRHGTAVDPPGLAERRAQTHCCHGHEFTTDNTYINKGRRHCRTCAREKQRRYAARKAA